MKRIEKIISRLWLPLGMAGLGCMAGHHYTEGVTSEFLMAVSLLLVLLSAPDVISLKFFGVPYLFLAGLDLAGTSRALWQPVLQGDVLAILALILLAATILRTVLVLCHWPPIIMGHDIKPHYNRYGPSRPLSARLPVEPSTDRRGAASAASHQNAKHPDQEDP